MQLSNSMGLIISVKGEDVDSIRKREIKCAERSKTYRIHQVSASIYIFQALTILTWILCEG